MKNSPNDVKNCKAVAIDLDGVVYIGNQAIAGAAIAIAGFRKAGLKVFFITNNSGKSRADICEKLNGLGISCRIGEIVTSGYVTVVFVKKLRPRKPVLVIGSDSLKQEFREAGLAVTGKADGSVMVVGLDRNFHYESIATGLQAVSRGLRFIACNTDASFPVEGGKSVPGCGAMVSAIEAAAGKKADYIIGKPNTYMLQLIKKTHNLRPEEILVIGDSLESDVGMAVKFGSPAVLIGKQRTNKVLTVPSLLQVWKRMKGDL